MQGRKPVYIQIPKAQLWRTIICALGQKGYTKGHCLSGLLLTSSVGHHRPGPAVIGP
jgi:hypothetical protein